MKITYFTLGITGLIFLVVGTLIVYVLIRYRQQPEDTGEPPQVFGSNQVELAWTIIPVLIIVVLFLATVRVIFDVQDAPKPGNAVDVVVIGHQYWWEFRYPKYHIVAANELHVPWSDPNRPTPTFLTLTSADVVHSFWVPRLAGKTDLLPNRVNEMWIDPHETGLFYGQCTQFCGVQHAKMLLRVYVDTPEQFQAWVRDQQRKPALTGSGVSTLHKASLTSGPDASRDRSATGREVFMHQACINCHAVDGTIATGRFGPDLTHLMSRSTLASGALDNTPENLRRWVQDPQALKPGSLMPAMHLTDEQNAEITSYLLTLK